MFDYMGSFGHLWIDLIVNIILILVVLLFSKKLEKTKFKYFVILFLLTRLIYYLFKLLTGGASFDNDTKWYYDYGRMFLGGQYPTMEYPQGALLLFTLFSFFASNIESFRFIFPLLQIPFGLLLIYCINWFGVRLKNKRVSNMGIIIYILSPSILWFWFNRFDEVVISLVMLSFVFLYANKKKIGTFFTFIGFSLKWFPILIMPTYWLYWLKKKRYKDIISSILVLALLSCLLFLPFYLVSSEKFVHTYTTQMPRTILGESSYFSLESAITGEQIAPYDSPKPPKIFTNNVALIITAIALLSWFFYVWKTVRKENLIVYSCFTIFLFVITNRIYSTQYIVWLLPLFILVAMHLKLTENEIKFYCIALILLQLFNFLKSPVPIENWIIFARLFWVLFISLILFSVIRLRKDQEIISGL